MNQNCLSPSATSKPILCKSNMQIEKQFPHNFPPTDELVEDEGEPVIENMMNDFVLEFESGFQKIVKMLNSKTVKLSDFEEGDKVAFMLINGKWSLLHILPYEHHYLSSSSVQDIPSKESFVFGEIRSIKFSSLVRKY
jgi:hypothetical protein